ncbi:MAG: hypothetical protein CMN93_07615 [Synechococcus sp. CPC35]|nr:hypothetical protein [Synechococcus sp. CPC35]
MAEGALELYFRTGCAEGHGIEAKSPSETIASMDALSCPFNPTGTVSEVDTNRNRRTTMETKTITWTEAAGDCQPWLDHSNNFGRAVLACSSLGWIRFRLCLVSGPMVSLRDFRQRELTDPD